MAPDRAERPHLPGVDRRTLPDECFRFCRRPGAGIGFAVQLLVQMRESSSRKVDAGPPRDRHGLLVTGAGSS